MIPIRNYEPEKTIINIENPLVELEDVKEGEVIQPSGSMSMSQDQYQIKQNDIQLPGSMTIETCKKKLSFNLNLKILLFS